MKSRLDEMKNEVQRLDVLASGNSIESDHPATSEIFLVGQQVKKGKSTKAEGEVVDVSQRRLPVLNGVVAEDKPGVIN